MFRLVVRITVGCCFGFAVLVTAAQVGGGWLHPEILSAVVTPGKQHIDDEVRIIILDVDRHLGREIALPLPHVRDVTLSSSGQNALFVTQTRADNLTQHGLYHLNLLSHRLNPVIQWEWESPVGPLGIEGFYGARWSPDERFVAFYNRRMQGLFIFDIEGERLQRVADLRTEPATRFALKPVRWSPDSSQIALNWGDGRLLVIDAQSGQSHEFTGLGAEYFDPYWSTDSQAILVGNYGRRSAPVNVVNVVNEQVIAVSDGLAAWQPEWWCDNRWLSFRAVQGGQRVIHTVDLHTGARYTLEQNHPVEAVLWSPGCEWFILAEARPGRLYLVDQMGRNVYLFAEDALWLGWVDAQTLLYYQTDTGGYIRLHHLTAGETPVIASLGRIENVSNQFTWSGTMMYYLARTSPRNRLVRLDLDAGRITNITDDNVMAYVVWQ